MKRRLGIAQALIHHPKVIIVDEPTTGLDPEERIRFRNLLSEVSENDVTIILSTHIVGDISSTCNCMALMNKGQVSFYGSPQDMMNCTRWIRNILLSLRFLPVRVGKCRWWPTRSKGMRLNRILPIWNMLMYIIWKIN